MRGVTYNKSKEIQNKNEEHWKIFRANNITLFSNTLNFEDIKLIDKSVKVKNDQILKKDDILICAGSGSREHIGKVAYITEDMDYSFGGFMAVIRTEKFLNSRFLFHILTGRIFKSYLGYTLKSSTINNLSFEVIKNFPIPIPPIEVQNEIVHILDQFTDLTTELQIKLQAELTARKKQYEYYRDQLLSFESLN
ncbi:restriction endonuclease subunit S, partial [Helicobacter sp. 12S02232-10]|uniref:restriction endonuclease subunit S n=1 Tax=Helicobacter sp. 12S02232-10 TaxID=1476197 RepID=UPI0015DFB802